MARSNADSLRNRIDSLLLLLERAATSSIILGFVAYSVGFLIKYVSLSKTLETGQNTFYFMMLVPYKEISTTGIIYTFLPVIGLLGLTILFHALDKTTNFSYSSEDASERKSRRNTFITMIPIILVVALLTSTSVASSIMSSIPLFILMTYMLWAEKILKPSSEPLLQRINWQAVTIVYLLLLLYSLINAGVYSKPGATFTNVRIERSASKRTLEGYLVGNDQGFLVLVSYKGSPQGVPIRDISGIKYIVAKRTPENTRQTYGKRLYKAILKVLGL